MQQLFQICSNYFKFAANSFNLPQLYFICSKVFNLQQFYFICSNFLICSMFLVGHRRIQSLNCLTFPTLNSVDAGSSLINSSITFFLCYLRYPALLLSFPRYFSIIFVKSYFNSCSFSFWSISISILIGLSGVQFGL